MIDVGLYITYVLLIVSLVVAVVFPVIYMVKYPGEGKSAFIGIGILLLVFLVGYLLSSGEINFKGMEEFNLSYQQVKLIGAGLITFYILGVIAVIAAVYAEVSSAVK